MTKPEFMQSAVIALMARADVYAYERIDVAEEAWRRLVNQGYAQDVTVDHHAAWLAKKKENAAR